MCECKYYELDAAAKKESEQLLVEYEAQMSDAERDELEAWAAKQSAGEPDPFAKCGEFCKHSKSGRGYPGEYVFHCAAPGNEHIIHIDFNESEII